jgi:phage shock protein A
LQRDDLAGAAIGRQTDIEDLLLVLQKSLHEQVERAKELESYIVALLAKKRELEHTLNDYLATLAQPAGAPGAVGLGDGAGRQARVDGAESSFGRVLARETGLAGVASGINGDAGKLKALAELQRNNRIAERLAALKAAKGDH